MGILNLSGGNMGPPGIICGGMCGMFGGERNGGRWGFGMPGGCCRGGLPDPGPCMTAGPGMVIPGATGEPRWLSLPASEGVPLSLLDSLVESSGGFTFPGGKFVGSNSAGMNGPPPRGMAVGDSMMGPGKAGGLPIGVTC